MKQLELNIPESWDEITLEMFDEISNLEGNPYDNTVKILEAITGTDAAELKKIPAIYLESSGINQKLMFLTKEPKKRIPNENLTLNGKEYKVCLYPAKWTAAQYLDYTAVLQGGAQKKMAKLIACFTIPSGKKYGEDYDFDKVVDEIYHNMPITVALGYAGFFQLQLSSFAKALTAYSMKRKKRLTLRRENRLYRKSLREASTKSGIHSS